MTTTTVWRVEHNCPNPHGPLQNCPTTPWQRLDSPNYGANLETPQSEESGLSHINLNYLGEYIFGTLPEQFPRWWSLRWDGNNKPIPPRLTGDWYAVKYEVEDWAMHVGVNQVIFDSYFATPVFKTQTDFPL